MQLSSVCLRTNERSAKRFRRVSRTCTVCACARSCVDTVTTETHLTAVRSLEAVDRRDSVADQEGRSSPREANLENEACEDGRTSQAASPNRAPLRAWLGAIVRQPEFADPGEAQLEFEARHDPLTRLPNRSLFIDLTRDALARIPRNRGLLALLAIDLDHFAEIATRFGDRSGDYSGEDVLVDVYEREADTHVMTFIVTDTTWTDASSGDVVVVTRFNLIHRARKPS